MINLINILFRFKRVLLVIIIGLAFLLYNPFKRSLIPNNEISIWFNSNDPTLKTYYEFQEIFGNDNVILLTYKEDAGALSDVGLQNIILLTKRLESIANIKSVISLSNFKDFRRITNNGLTKIVFEPWITDEVLTISDQLKRDIMSSRLINDKLIKRDTSMVKLIVQMENTNIVEGNMDSIIKEIERISRTTLGVKPFQLNGTDIINHELNVLSRSDFVKFTGICYLFIFFFITLYYRRIYYLLLVFTSSFLSLWFTLGIYGALGYQLNIFTVMTPPIVISLSVIVMIHILNRFESISTGNSQQKTIITLNKLLNQICYFQLSC